jgi:signal transduction histidine kinase
LKKKAIFLFFFLPLIGIVVLFFILSTVNRSYIKTKVEDLVKDQLRSTAEILKANISHFLSENYQPDEIFDFYSGEENIYYMALLDEKKNILGWKSQFEGYLPLSQKTIQEKESWIIDSPAGKIFNFFSSFSAPDQKTYHIYLGYSLVNLEEMIARSRRNFLILFAVIGGIGIIFFLGIYRIQAYYLKKEKETEKEKREKERFREISAFTSGIAHEIKNPLNSLSLLLELLQKKSPQVLRENVSQGRTEVQKISRIIDLFSASLKPMNLHKEKFVLKDLIEDIGESLRRERSSSPVDMHYSEDKEIVMTADKGLMSQAFFNLLRNSLDATEKGTIRIRAKEHRKKVLITFTDSGKGMSDEEKSHIFEPFYSHKKEGMGIGLYLTKKIIEDHQGRITFDSRMDEGTTFTIQVPGG